MNNCGIKHCGFQSIEIKTNFQSETGNLFIDGKGNLVPISITGCFNCTNTNCPGISAEDLAKQMIAKYGKTQKKLRQK